MNSKLKSCGAVITSVFATTYPSSSQSINLDKDFSVLGYDQYNKITTFCDGKKIKYDGTWQVTEQNILDFESHIRSIKGNPNVDYINTFPNGIYSFVRQYGGITIDGKKILVSKLIEKFLVAYEIDWRKNGLVVCGKNAEKKGFLYDVEKEILVEIQKN